MAINLNWFNIRVLTTSRFFIALLIVVMCTQFVPIEGMGVSPVKVAVMAIAPLIFIAKTPQINKAVIWGFALWLCCFFCAYFAGPIRWSTLGYYGMFIMTFICFYSLLYTAEVSIEWFANLLKSLIIVFGVVLILQQISVLIGLRNNPLINLYPSLQHYISITKLPILTQEPSSSARMLAVFMLGYLECYKLMNGGVKATFSELFDRDNRLMSILFLWAMLTMGSGTAFIALGLLALYFIKIKNALYTIPVLIIVISIGEYMNLEQLERVNNVVMATTTGDLSAVRTTDASASVRITPLVNLFTKSDFSDYEFWFGKGTAIKLSNSNQIAAAMINPNAQLAIINQYGFLSMLVSLILVYNCMIRKFFSIETLMFIFLFGLSLGNVAYTWGALMIFAGITHFQKAYDSDDFYNDSKLELISTN